MAIHTNENISSYFSLRCGTYKGCSLSPFLFAVAIEPLAIAFCNNDGVKGIHREGREHKVSLYADDMLIFLTDPSLSVPNLLKLLSDFGKISGYKVIMQKGELVTAGVPSKFLFP